MNMNGCWLLNKHENGTMLRDCFIAIQGRHFTLTLGEGGQAPGGMEHFSTLSLSKRISICQDNEDFWTNLLEFVSNKKKSLK